MGYLLGAAFTQQVDAARFVKPRWPCCLNTRQDFKCWRAVGKTGSLIIMEGAPSQRELYRPGQGERKPCPVNHSGLPGT